MSKQTAVQWLREKLKKQGFLDNLDIGAALQMERIQMIDFHKWMKENDTAENAEKFFHYSDEDMLNEYNKAKANESITD